jgi:hypothetical protein
MRETSIQKRGLFEGEDHRGRKLRNAGRVSGRG